MRMKLPQNPSSSLVDVEVKDDHDPIGHTSCYLSLFTWYNSSREPGLTEKKSQAGAFRASPVVCVGQSKHDSWSDQGSLL